MSELDIKTLGVLAPALLIDHWGGIPEYEPCDEKRPVSWHLNMKGNPIMRRGRNIIDILPPQPCAALHDERIVKLLRAAIMKKNIIRVNKYLSDSMRKVQTRMANEHEMGLKTIVCHPINIYNVTHSANSPWVHGMTTILSSTAVSESEVFCLPAQDCFGVLCVFQPREKILGHGYTIVRPNSFYMLVLKKVPACKTGKNVVR